MKKVILKIYFKNNFQTKKENKKNKQIVVIKKKKLRKIKQMK